MHLPDPASGQPLAPDRARGPRCPLRCSAACCSLASVAANITAQVRLPRKVAYRCLRQGSVPSDAVALPRGFALTATAAALEVREGQAAPPPPDELMLIVQVDPTALGADALARGALQQAPLA